MFLLAVGVAGPAQAATPLFGVNLSGLEMGSGLTEAGQWTVPDPTTMLGEHVQLIRLPFDLERLQPTALSPLDPNYLGDITSILDENAAAQVVTVLDPNNYGYIWTDSTASSQAIGIVPEATADYLDDVTRLAAAVRGRPLVAIGLMNEPHTQTCAQLAPVWQQAITAMRGAGFTGVLSVPATNWQHASDFVSSGCASLFATLTDPQNNLVFEVHNYLDPGQSGRYAQPIASPDIGSVQLAPAIAWARASGARLFVGETATPPDPQSLAALTDELTTIKDSPDVFWGVAMWGAGPWWPPTYNLRLDPINGVIQPQMTLLDQFAATPSSVVLTLVEDAWSGDARYLLTLDGQPLPGPRAEPVTRSSGQADLVTIPGPFTTGTHHLTVTFLNDAYGGSPSTDRNLYLIGATLDGAVLPNAFSALTGTGASATVTFATP
jgi:endoglucanase